MNIIIEFCVKWNYHPEFDRVSAIIRKLRPAIMISGNPTPPRTGAFEVTIDGKLVFSKLKSGGFPGESDIKLWFVWAVRLTRIRFRQVICPTWIISEDTIMQFDIHSFSQNFRPGFHSSWIPIAKIGLGFIFTGLLIMVLKDLIVAILSVGVIGNDQVF